MSESFKDRIEFETSEIKIAIKPRKKGTLIYLDERSPSDLAVIRSFDDESSANESKAYLVFDIPYELDTNDFEELFEEEWLGMQIRYFAGWTEIACYYPQCLDSELLKILEKKKIVRVSMKESYHDGEKPPSYINARGFQTVYNMITMFKHSVGNTKYMMNQHESENSDGQESERDVEETKDIEERRERV